MSSKIMIRSCGSSIRTLLNRHLRPTFAATSVKTETPGSIYNWQYLLPNSSVPRTVYFAHGFSNEAAGYSGLKEAARGRRTENYDEDSVDEDDDDIEMEYSEFDSDDSEFDTDNSEFDTD